MATGARLALDDAAWLHMDSPENLMVVNVALLFDTTPDWSAVIDAFRERVVEVFPRFRQRIVHRPAALGAFGGPHWKSSASFHLDNHLHRHRLPDGDPDTVLQDYLSEQASIELDHRWPRWSLHLIDGYGDGAAMLLRTHHSMADGLGLVQLLLALADHHGDGLLPGQMPLQGVDRPAVGSPGGNAVSSAIDDSVAFVTNPARMRNAAAQVRDNALVYRKLMRLDSQSNLLQGSPSGAKSLTWSEAVPLELVKHLASRTSSTVNDLALSVITGALRRYLADRGPLPDKIGVTIPLNLRALDEPLAPELGNQIGLVFVNLPVSLDDPMRRLEHIRERTSAIKASPEGRVVRSGMAMVGAMPRGAIAKGWMEQFTRRSSAIITNIAGPPTAVAIAGAPLRGFVLWVPASGTVGVGLSIVSYDGALRIGVSVDRAIVPDPKLIIEAVRDEFAAHLALI